MRVGFGSLYFELNLPGFEECGCFETLLYSELITEDSTKINHITPDMVKTAPTFSQVADQIFSCLDKKVYCKWN